MAESPNPYAVIAASNVDSLSFPLKRVLDSGDPQQCYAKEFIRVVAACAGADQRDTERKLKTRYSKDFNIPQWRADVRDSKASLTAAIKPKALGDLPLIETTGASLPELVNQACQALIVRNEKAKDMYIMSQSPVILIPSKTQGRQQVKNITEDRMHGDIARAADWRKFVPSTGSSQTIFPPREITRDIMARPEDIGLPELAGIMQRPFLRPDGSLAEQPGYDEATQLYIDHSAPKLGNIPTDQISAQQSAQWLLDEVFSDFPFENESSRQNALGLLVCACVRNVVPGGVPAAAVSAPAHGAGKSMIAQIVHIVDTGRRAAMTGLGKDEEEIEKQLTSIFLRNPSGLVIYDNISGFVDSANLSRALTSDWDCRILGGNTQVALTTKCTHIWNGKNLTLSEEIARRTYLIRLEPTIANSARRSGFKHPDLLEWVENHRKEILAHIFTIARAWFAANQPWSPHVAALGSFESFTRIMGGIMTHAGQFAYLQNQDSHMEIADIETSQWVAFIEAIFDWRGDYHWTAAQLAGELNSRETLTNQKLRETMPDAVAGCLERKAPEVSLGRVLRNRKDRRYGTENARITTNGLTVSPIRWVVQKG